MNNDSKRSVTGSGPAEIEMDNRLKSYYQKDVGPYPDFAKMAEVAMAEGNDELATSVKIDSKTSAWYIIPKRTILTAAAIVLMFGLLKFSFYAIPRWQAFAYGAAQSIPFADHLISEQDVGLLQEAEKGNIQTRQLTSEVDRFRIDILGTYADSNRTVVFFQIYPPEDKSYAEKGSWMPENIKFVDQFGISRHKSYSVSLDTNSYKGNIEFPAVPGWLRALGARFHLEIGALNWTTDKGGYTTDKVGPWTMEWVQEWQDAKKIIHPGAAVANEEVEIKLKKVTLTPSSTKLDYTALFKKSAAHENLEMYIENASDGTRYEFLSSGFRTSGFTRAGTGDILFPPLEGAGEYQFIIKRTDGVNGEWVLPFTVH
jgi:hypothetical protein